MTENSSCTYDIIGRSAAGCAIKGDPFSIPSNFYRNNPANSFGFVVLGATITVILAVLYSVGESRSWWEPIKRM